jgi:Domain of unknown function (DUF4062)
MHPPLRWRWLLEGFSQLDLVEEREAVREALHKKGASALVMEYFVATPSAPRETALGNLRNSDMMILVIGFKAGSVLPDSSGSTYTSAEYDELLKLGATRSTTWMPTKKCFLGVLQTKRG